MRLISTTSNITDVSDDAVCSELLAARNYMLHRKTSRSFILKLSNTA